MKRLNKEQKLEKEFKDYNATMKRLGAKQKTLKEFIAYKKGNSRLKVKGSDNPLEAKTLIRNAPKYPSGEGVGKALGKKQEKKYTGDKLIGIGTMHKSNMVPIFKAEDAKDIANMRRN